MRDDIDALIEGIVDAARIPGRRRRDDLRRELRSHFEDSAATPEALEDAVARFGSARQVGRSFRQVYSRDYMLWYVFKVCACVAAAAIAAMLIEAIAGLRVEAATDSWRLSPGFAHAAPFGVVLSLALVAAAEATRPPFRWSRTLVFIGFYAIVAACVSWTGANGVGAFVNAGIMAAIGVGVARAAAAWTSRALLTLAAFTAAEYLLHRVPGIAFGPMRAFAASVVLVMLWASTIAIVALSDRAFLSAFRTT